MKICWDNLENLVLGKNKKYLINRTTKTKYYFLDECVICKEPFLSGNGKTSKVCTKECSHKYQSYILKGRQFSEEHKKNISDSCKGRVSSFKGKKHSEEQKKKGSEIRSNGMYEGKNNPRYNDHRTGEEMYGKEKSDKLKKVKSDLGKGENNVNCKKNHGVYKENGKRKQKISLKKMLDTKFQKYGSYSPFTGISYDEIYGEEKSQEIRNEISQSLKKYYFENGTSKNNSSFGYSGGYKNIYFRSGLELSFLLGANNNKLTIESAENKKFVVKYYYDNEWKNYFPDFYIKESGDVIEIKPIYMLDNDVVITKIKFAKDKYKHRYNIISERELKILDAPYIDKNIIYNMNLDGIISLSESTLKRIKGE